jgi:hypothetical protein
VPAISAPFDCEISPCEYQSKAAATRISFTNSAGDKRSAESAPSGTSNVTVAIVTSFLLWTTAYFSAAKATQALIQIERTIRRVRLGRSIVQESSRTMPTIVKTLDAIHLASAIVIRERRGIELLFATHDAQQAIAARALGFTTLES